jgi:hypothetical protein
VKPPPALRPSAAQIAELRAYAERNLTDEERRAYAEAPLGEAERAEIVALHEWFTRRYPTPAARLAYVRRAAVRWRAPSGG